MPAAAAVREALPWHAGGARPGAGTAAVTGETLVAPAAEGSPRGVGLGAPHPTHVPRVSPASQPLSAPWAPQGGPTSSLSSSALAARPDIIRCAGMTVQGLLLPASRRCRGLSAGEPAGNGPGADGVREPERGTCVRSRTVVGAGQHRGCFHVRGPGVTATVAETGCARCRGKLRQGAARGLRAPPSAPPRSPDSGQGHQRLGTGLGARPPGPGRVPAPLPCLPRGKRAAPALAV